MKITGIKCLLNNNEIIMNCKCVLLTTGGFGYSATDNTILKKYANEYYHYPTTNGKQSTGDGIKLLEKINANLVDMNKIQIHPTGFIDNNDKLSKTKFLAPELFRGMVF